MFRYDISDNQIDIIVYRLTKNVKKQNFLPVFSWGPNGSPMNSDIC